MSYRVHLPLFEGPFDLLVYLIESARMSIYDIRIAEITGQYMAALDRMQELHVEVSSEFMVLAATLLDIKSRMILPREMEEPETSAYEDPRRELAEMLVQYKLFKARADALEKRRERAKLLFEKPQEDISIYTENPREELALSMDGLQEAFAAFLSGQERLRNTREQYEKARQNRVSVEKKMASIASRVRDAFKRGIRRLSFRSLLEAHPKREELVVTFASLLQMMKDHQVDAEQKKTYGEIFVTKAPAKRKR